MARFNCCNWIVVAFVVFLISFIPVTSELFVLLELFPWGASYWTTGFHAAFAATVAQIWINYFLSVLVDPGHVPPLWEPPHDDATALVEIKQSNSAPRYCRTCCQYKPPRTHHCRQCERCVLKMDHHCPWINNCVGYYNHGYFVRFLFYVDVAVSMCVAGLLYQVYDWLTMEYPSWYYSDRVFLQLVVAIINLLMAVPVLLSVGALSAYHFYYLLTNCTTIEAMEKERKALLRMHDGSIGSLPNPYDVGMLSNVRAVLGHNPLFWCLPVAMRDDDRAAKKAAKDSGRRSSTGDAGTVFPLAPDLEWEYITPADPHGKGGAARGGDGSGAHGGRGPGSGRSHRSHIPPSPYVHVRQGSEGYEVRMDVDPYAQWYAMQPAPRPGHEPGHHHHHGNHGSHPHGGRQGGGGGGAGPVYYDRRPHDEAAAPLLAGRPHAGGGDHLAARHGFHQHGDEYADDDDDDDDDTPLGHVLQRARASPLPRTRTPGTPTTPLTPNTPLTPSMGKKVL